MTWHQPTLWEIVDDEALHDWLDNRPPKSDERPDPYEYEEDGRER